VGGTVFVGGPVAPTPAPVNSVSAATPTALVSVTLIARGAPARRARLAERSFSNDRSKTFLTLPTIRIPAHRDEKSRNHRGAVHSL
jgi:hypothetical protein